MNLYIYTDALFVNFEFQESACISSFIRQANELVGLIII